MYSATPNRCIDFVYSPDDGGWYAHEYDFTRPDHATRASATFPSRDALISALNNGKVKWQKWD